MYMYVLSYYLSIKIILGVSITILSMKKKSYAYFMTHFVYTVKWHIGNVFNKPPRQNAPTDSVLTSVILKGIEWAFRKVYPTKIPGMVHQGLLAPQSLVGMGFAVCHRDGSMYMLQYGHYIQHHSRKLLGQSNPNEIWSRHCKVHAT